MDRVLDFLSSYSVALNYRDIPDGVIHKTKRLVIDTLGCAIGSYAMEPVRIAREHAAEVVSAPGATVLGTRHRTSPELAAFVNGVMARYLDFNDTSMAGTGGHPSDNIMGVLAAAEYAGADMRTTIVGIVLAYEIHDRFGTACSAVRANGWDNAVYVVVASAAGAGKALSLGKQQMANALALAAVANASMNQTRVGELSMWKGCAAANAARNGVFAALMARRGLTGPAQAFEGPLGYGKQLGAPVNLPPFAGGSIPFTIESAKFKCFPCDYEAQCCITPALELHKVLKGQIAEIEKIDIETYEFAVKIAADTRDKWHPVSRETADHSIPFVIAVALTRGTVWLDDFSDERIRDPRINALMQKIQVRATAEFAKEWPESFPFRITVTTRSGLKHVQEVRYAKGHPKNPMTDDEVEAKFRKLAEPAMGPGAASNALSHLWHLEDANSVREMLGLFVVDAAH